jgi:hypothetical protein
MKKIIPFLISIILILNCNAQIASDSCNFKFLLYNNAGYGWPPGTGIEITVDGEDSGFVTLPFGLGNDYAEEIVVLPSGEIQLIWHGVFMNGSYHFEVYNSSDELIYTCPDDLPGELFFTYQNECLNDIECLPLTDFKGVYTPEEKQVKLSWEAPESTALIGFNIYRNDSLIVHVTPATIFYSDNTEELENGNYKYCVAPVYPFVCDLDEECVEVPINVGIKDYKDNIMIYPNPAINMIHISDMVLKAKIYNNTGQLILTQHNTNTINVSKLQNGIYILSIETLAGNITQKKIIINH